MNDRSESYELLGKLGTGSFGTVWKARHKDSGEYVAIKQIDLESSSDDIAEIQQEITLLSQCQSDHVTRYYESFITGFRLWIVMEYLAGGSALDAMKDRPFSEKQAAVMCRELLEGLAYLHSQNKIHRDIKAANVLLTSTGRVKLADFGVAAQLSSNMSRKHTFVGTPFWMAPEVIIQAGYNYKADIWSLGITTFEFLKGEPPLSELHPMRAVFFIPKSPAPVLSGAFSPQCKDFVKQCLQVDVAARPNAHELLDHPFIKQAGSSSLLADLIDEKERLPETPVEELALMNMSQGSRTVTRQDQAWDFDTIRAPKTAATTDKTARQDSTIRAAMRDKQLGTIRSNQASRHPVSLSSDSAESLSLSWGTAKSTDSSFQQSLRSMNSQSQSTALDQDLESVARKLRELAALDQSAVQSFLELQLSMIQSTRATENMGVKRSPIAELLFMRWADDLRKKSATVT